MRTTRNKRAVRKPPFPCPRTSAFGSVAARALWAYAGAPLGFTPAQIAALVTSKPNLQREMRRHADARFASLAAYARAVALGLSHDAAARIAMMVQLRLTGWGRLNVKRPKQKN
jgi:hypothetical protein